MLLLTTNMFILMIPVYCALQVQLYVVTIKKWTIFILHKTILVNYVTLLSFILTYGLGA